MIFTPKPWQAEFLARTERESTLAFRGRGAGASTALMLWLLETTADPKYRGVLVVPKRQLVGFTRVMLMDHARSAARWSMGLRQVQFPSGALVDVRVLETPRDLEAWRGTDYRRVAVDLLGDYPKRWWSRSQHILMEIDGYVGPTSLIRAANGEHA